MTDPAAFSLAIAIKSETFGVFHPEGRAFMLQFSADEILNLAVRIEQNGAAFYRKAATLASRPEDADYLRQLAAMEDDHERVFLEMQSQLTAQEQAVTAMDPFDQNTLYLRAMADAHGGEGTPSAAAALTGNETMEQILGAAIELEKQSILYYIGILDMVPAERGKKRISRIIAEEKDHFVTLKKKLGALSSR